MVSNRDVIESAETYLEHVAENAEHAVETSILGFGTVGLPLDAGHHFGYENQVDDQRRGEERVLADIEDADGLVTTQEDLGIVLIKSTLVVSHSGHVLDDDSVIGVLALLVEDGVGSHHVIDDIGLGDLLGAELLLRAEVHAVVVAKMVVAGNGGELDTGVDQEVDQGGLHLSLTRLEVVTTNESIVLLGKLDSTRNEGVLGRAVDEGDTFQDTGNGKDGGGRNLLMAILDSLEQVVRSVVDAVQDVGEALGVGGPLNNDLVKTIGGLELPSLLLDLTWTVGEVELTECPCGSAPHGHWKLWCQE
jgi:hypothetical protein